MIGKNMTRMEYWIHQQEVAELKAQLSQQAQRIEQAVEALAPLAALVRVIPDDEQIIHRDNAPLYAFDGVTLTYGDVRRAAAALAALRPAAGGQ